MLFSPSPDVIAVIASTSCQATPRLTRCILPATMDPINGGPAGAGACIRGPIMKSAHRALSYISRTLGHRSDSTTTGGERHAQCGEGSGSLSDRIRAVLHFI